MAPNLRTVFNRIRGGATGHADETGNGGPETPKTDAEKSTASSEGKEQNPVNVGVTETISSNEREKESHDGIKGEDALAVSSDGEINKNPTSPEEDEDSKYLSGTKLYLLTFGLALSTFVIALDNTIIATAIPRITTDFKALNVRLPTSPGCVVSGGWFRDSLEFGDGR